MKRLIILLLCVCIFTAGCASKGSTETASKLAFASANSIEELTSLDGKTVQIIGYMATLSPLSGEYMYLMNMPYQSCPFCVPNTTQLSNTMAVYAKKGSTFEYTDQAIQVTGTLKIEDYTDDYGYEYNYRITDAVYNVVDLSTVSSTYALWQSIAADGIVSEVNAMFDYLHFICQWSDYYLSYYDANGDYVQVSMYPGDVENYLVDDSEYGYYTESQQSYYDGLISRVRAISPDGLESLVKIIERGSELNTYALADLRSGAYTYVEDGDYYTQDNFSDLYSRWLDVYYDFSDWLASWEV